MIPDIPENIYYRWRVYSFAQGDTEIFWRIEPFLLSYEKSPSIWHPPALPISKLSFNFNKIKYCKLI